MQFGSTVNGRIPRSALAIFASCDEAVGRSHRRVTIQDNSWSRISSLFVASWHSAASDLRLQMPTSSRVDGQVLAESKIDQRDDAYTKRSGYIQLTAHRATQL